MQIKTVVNLEYACNARHLGGYRCERELVTKDNAFIRCENLEQLTSKDIAMLAKLGVTDAIDLRCPGECMERPSAFSKLREIAYHNIPVFDADCSPGNLAAAGYDMIRFYMNMAEYAGQRLADILRCMILSDGGVIFYCAMGKDRTGVVAALLLLVAGVDKETVVNEYCYTEQVSQPLRKEFLQFQPEGLEKKFDRDVLSAKKEYINAFIEQSAGKHGGAVSYLMNLGIKAHEIDAMRRKILQNN